MQIIISLQHLFLGLKNVENKIVQRIIRLMANCETSDQLFALMGLDNETNDKDTNDEWKGFAFSG